jgi:hypothetical protein
MTATQGHIRSARLTDLPALGELSRLSHAYPAEEHERPVRSLGLPVTASQVSVFSLFRMPVRAFRPHDPLYVHEIDGRLVGLARVERGDRDEWTIVELDAVDHGDAGDIRFRLVQHLLRDGARSGASRFHVACSDAGGNIDLFMQAGFARYGEESILYRPPDAPWPVAADAAWAAERGIRPATSLDPVDLDSLYRAVTPAPVVRLEGYRVHDWERQGGQWRVPRSSLTPILRFADIDVFVQEGRGSTGQPCLAAFAQVGVAKEDQPHYLRVLSRPGHDVTDLIRYGVCLIGERSGETRRRSASDGPSRGILTAVRTYESPLDRRLEEAQFQCVARVSLFLKETLVRVAEPALVPAINRP